MKNYSRNLVFKKTLEYFGGDELATNVWIDKYSLKDKNGNIYEVTPEDMHRRIARELFRIEDRYPNPVPEQKIFSLLDRFRYIIPQGSPMFGIGNDFALTSLSNCFVIGNNDKSDSYGSIMRTDEEQVQIMKRRGGVGHDISHLRPSGSLANNSVLKGMAGSSLYMERYSNSTREVSQGDRRGALMLSIDVRHPDTDKFIDAKLEQGKVTGANISVKITDKFMEAVNDDRDFVQTFPIDLDINNHTAFSESLLNNEIEYNKLYDLKYKNDNEYDGCYAKRIRARDLWNKIIFNAWKSAEPGVLFWDRVTQESPADSYGKDWKTTSTNPSLRGNTLVLTEKGIFPIKQIAEEFPNIKLLNCNGDWCEAYTRKTGEEKRLYKITFVNGNSVFCTAEHKWPILSRKGELINRLGQVNKKIPQDIKKRDKVFFPLNTSPINNKECSFSEEDGFLLGWWYGDGWETFSKFHNAKQIGFQFGDEDNEFKIGERVLNKVNTFLPKNRQCRLRQDRQTKSQTFNTYNKDFIKYLEKLGQDVKEKGLPKTIWTSNSNFIKGFIDGLFSADGSVYESKTKNSIVLTLTSSRKQLVEDLRKLLAFYGISANINHQTQTLKNRDKVYDVYYLTVSTYWLRRFQECFNLSHNRKQQVINHAPLSTFNRGFTVKSVELTDQYEDVYDATVNDWSHTFFTEVGLTGNCGELPLCEYDSCRLLVLNLYSYVDNPFTEKASFNYNLFKEHVHIAQRFMDDVVDLEIEKVDKIIKKIKNDPEPDYIKHTELQLWEKIRIKAVEGRRTGLGITAEGDMLAALGLRYGTDDATDFSDNLHEILAVESYKESINLARERGCFPIWSKIKERNNPFISRIIDSKYFTAEDMIRYDIHGRRNIANLTIAPTGSVSLMSQTTSGIEPVFLPYYKRRRKTDDPEKSVFRDEVGDMWEEYKVFHHKFVDWFNVNWYKLDYKWFDIDYHPDLESLNDEQLEKVFQKSPYYKSTSADVDYLGKVELQGRVQKWIDHSISVTVNMPEDTDIETVSKVYNLAHSVGCKGMTIYREGSRSGVLLSDKKKEKKEVGIIYNNSPKRLETLNCDIYNITRGKQPFTILVGLLEGKPYEIFALEKLSNSEFSDKIEHGEIKKVKSKTYQLSGLYRDTKYVVDNIVDFMSDDEQKDTRKFSQMLRHGIHPKYIIEQINEYATISSFDKVVAKALSYYLNGEVIKQDKKCPECGSSNLKHETGCVTCLDCNWSKCN